MTIASFWIAGGGGDASCPFAVTVKKDDLHDQLPGPTPCYSVVPPLTNVQGFFNSFRDLQIIFEVSYMVLSKPCLQKVFLVALSEPCL